jgi:DUF1365 family protein
MNSCLYECRILHARFTPQPHRFVYRIFLFALDLDELPALPRRLALFSHNRANLYSFRDRDYFPTAEPLHPPAPPAQCNLLGYTPGNLRERVVRFLAGRGIDLTAGRVTLVTLPRIFGYLFNPVSFYFCHDRTGAPVAALAEVTNTFREMKLFPLGPDTQVAPGEFRLRVPKHFYVSPFSDVDVSFDFTLRTPGDQLSVQIDDYTGAERTLTSVLTGARRELTGARLFWFTLKYPLLSLRVITLIHWHAFRLWLKRVPSFAKSARAADQRDLHRPHASIVSSRDPA